MASGRHAYQSGRGTSLHKPDAGGVKRVRGVLHTPEGTEHGRIVPSSAEVSEYVEHFWSVRWRLAAPQEAEVLTYPSIHVVFEGDEERIVGVVRQKFVRRLVGEGEVFGIKFRPGMFRPLAGAPAYQLTDRVRPLSDEFGDADVGAAVRSHATMALKARAVERALKGALPPPDPRARRARTLVDEVRGDRRLHSVSLLARHARMTERALQRLFRDFVGVSPKWVVRRFRLQEAAELLATTTETVAAVAATLGYFDQAHFARDFKSVVGEPPAAFLARRNGPRSTVSKR